MKIRDYITKDTMFENENKTVIVVLRILYIISFLAFVIDTIVAGPDAIMMYSVRFFGLFSGNIVLFFTTYRFRTKISNLLFMLYTFIWTICMIPVYGWSAGMQNYYIIILMLCFFASYNRAVLKFINAGWVLVFRIATIGVFGGIRSDVVTTVVQDKLIQITNISAVFLEIIFISYMFSRKENEAENKLMKYNDRLLREANTDKLTGLYNRRRADEYLKVVEESNDGQPISIAIGDIDFFKKVNDTYGHDAGDEVLKFISSIMMTTCREGTFLARWGGEEFLIVFPDCNGDNAYIAVERLRADIEDSVINIGDDAVNVTMTFGLSEYSFSRNSEETIKEADEKLYLGKQGGRNRVVY